MFESGTSPAQIIEDGVASSSYVYRTIRSLKQDADDADDAKKYNIRFINDDDVVDELPSREVEVPITIVVKVKVEVEVDDD